MITLSEPQRNTFYRTLSRRRFLGAAAAAGVAAVGVSACEVETGGGGDASSSGDDSFTFPDPAGELPEGDVTVRWMSSGPGAKSEVFNNLFPAYERKHPNISMTYNELPNNKIGEVLPLQIRNDNADDVFQVLNGALPVSELVNTGKLAALEDVVPGFEEWKAAMPEGTFLRGVDVFDGKTYQLRTSTDRRLKRLLLFDVAIMDQAGYDPVTEPFDLDTFREAARKITEQGKGETFGLMTAGGDPTDLVELHGGPPNFDWKSGTYQFTHDLYVEVIELLKAIVDDESVFPGWVSLKDQEMRGQFPLGRAGMLLNGAWNFSVWANDFPDFEYGVARPPAPAGHGYRHYTSDGGTGYAVFANAPDDHKLVAGDLIHFLGTEAGQVFWAKHDGAADPAWSETAISDVRESEQLSEQDKTAFDLYDELVRSMPEAAVGNPEAEKVRLLLKPVQPNLPKLTQGYLAGEIGDLRKALQDLNDASEKALDEAIAEAQNQGAQVSRDDWVFANWDPAKDYTAADYENR